MYKYAEICPSSAYSRLNSPRKIALLRSERSRSRRPLLTWRERVQRSVSRLKKPWCLRALGNDRADGLIVGGPSIQKVKKHSAVIVFRRMLLVSIAHAMDPTQRAGQSEAANEHGAMRYGRVAKNRRRRGRKGFKSILSMLIKLFLAFVIPTMIESSFITDCIIKSLKARFKPAKDKKEQRKKISNRYNGALCFAR